MTTADQNIESATAMIQKAAGKLRPKIAVILGSGLGAVADLLDETSKLSYADLPGFPQLGVQGHEGSLRIGTVDSVPVMFLKGRVHLYEGKGAAPIKAIIRTLKSVGVSCLFLTNAAGSLRREYGPGSLVAISDHINLTGMNPLTGPNDDIWGARFPPMENAWDRDLRALLVARARAVGVSVGEGVYAGVLGPNFETPAEIRMLKILGADTVGMSTVAENIIARHCGISCVGCSAITNLGAGMGDGPLSHDQTLEGAALAERAMATALRAFVTGYAARP